MGTDEHDLPRYQRVAAYAVIVREEHILLSRIAPAIVEEEMWTLPGGGIDFGEHPADAVVREVHEETGLACVLEQPLWIGSARRVVDRTEWPTDMHSVRIVYTASVAPDAPEPRVVEVDGSTVDARWIPLAEVHGGLVPTVPMVREALGVHRPARRQRLAAYALVERDGRVLLTRNSPRGPRPGTWSLPGGGVDHGESPADAVVREVAEECGLEAVVGRLVLAHDEHFTGTAPSGREEDFHGVGLVFEATVAAGEPRRPVDDTGTTDDVAWVPLDAMGTVVLSPVAAEAVALLGTR